jgi:uncharacterized membrane protein/sporulation protein YlmC with PRC-barrel domain
MSEAAPPARELPIDAKVLCTDGEVGRLTDVVVDPVRRRVTHLVVRQDALPAREVLVPAERIAGSSRTEVRLDCTRDEMAGFPEFTETRYVPASSPEAQAVIADWQMTMATASYDPYGYQPLVLPYDVTAGGEVPITEERVPEGELTFSRGARVEDRDSQDVGEVEAFVVDPGDETISHFVLRTGHLAGAREVTLPVSTVTRARGGTVRLALTKQEVEALPAVPARRHYDAASGGPGTLELLSLVFPAAEQADEALRTAKGAAAQGRVGRFDAAVVRKGANGRVRSREEHDLSTGRGALLGAIAGGVLSLVAGPVGLAAGLAGGGVAGGVVGRVVDRGVPDRYVRDLGRALRPGTSALVLLVERGSEEALLEVLRPLEGSLLRLALTDEMVARLTSPQDPGAGSQAG